MAGILRVGHNYISHNYVQWPAYVACGMLRSLGARRRRPLSVSSLSDAAKAAYQAHIAMANTVMAYAAMAHVAMAYAVMAHIAMASWPLVDAAKAAYQARMRARECMCAHTWARARAGSLLSPPWHWWCGLAPFWIESHTRAIRLAVVRPIYLWPI